MSGNSEAIVETFRQIQDIYKHIYMLMETSKELMQAKMWKPLHGHAKGNVDYYEGTSHGFLRTIVRIPFYLQLPFASDRKRTQIKYITVMIDDETPVKDKDFEPVVVGTTLKFMRGEKPTTDWDGYWWYHWKWNEPKESNSERHGPWTLENYEVREIQEQDWIREDEFRSNLLSVRTFGIPLVEVTNEETLEEKIIKRLLDD